MDAGLGPQQRNHLPQSQVQNFVQVERLRGNDRHRVQRIQFAVPPANFILSPFLFRDIEQEPK